MTEYQKNTIVSMRNKGCTYAEIAAHLDISINSIKSFTRRSANKKVCKNCGQSLPNKTKTKPRVFCCDKCKQTWWNLRRKERQSEKIEIVECLCCGKSFTAYIGDNRKFCSQACYRKRGEMYEQ